MIHDDDEVDHGGRVDHDDDGNNDHDIHDDENSAQSHLCLLLHQGDIMIHDENDHDDPAALDDD